MPAFCGVIGCANKRTKFPEKFYFRLPAVDKRYGGKREKITRVRRGKWLANLARADLTEAGKRHLLVCSDHFLSGRPAVLDDTSNPDWAPTQNLGHRKVSQELVAISCARHQRIQERKSKKDKEMFMAAQTLMDMQEYTQPSSDKVYVGKDVMEPFEFVTEVKEEPIDHQVSSTTQQPSVVDSVSDHSQDALSQCDEIGIKKEEEEDVCIKDEPIEDLDPLSNCTTFVPMLKSKPSNTSVKKDHSQFIRKTHKTGGGHPPTLPGQPEQPQTLLQNPASPIVIIGSAEREFSGQDTGHLPCTSSTPNTGAAQPDQSFRGQKRQAAENKSAAYKRCSRRQIEFRDKLESKIDSQTGKACTILDKIASAADKVGFASGRIASAVDEVGSAVGRIASSAERTAAALEKMVGLM
ncbi:uncharacterized protein LOC126986406 isoform X2 [Eriocheir sinensis]|uniref:uncharacterized protein LOC126986406 isoform X2 n=1 Tax=Eriocheir sinensis TaxID=95602 RepID=UPI0021C6E30F|nr:uncharacterized protein LOC126986406 isoform X2 [Eriocheir sinensis]